MTESISVLNHEICEIEKIIDLKFVEIKKLQGDVLVKQTRIKELEESKIMFRWCKMCARVETNHESGICDLCINARKENLGK